MKYICRLTVCLIFAFTVFTSGQNNEVKIFKIKVFNDVNKNFKLDKEEFGIEGVKVSNQYTIVKTDKNGYCELPKTGNGIIYVIKPADYQTPLNSFNIPIFYCSPYSSGSQFILPQGKNGDELYFPLYVVKADDKFDALFLGDPQSRNLEEVGYMRDDFVKNQLNNNYKFALMLGDISYDNKELYKPTNEILSKMNIPLYFVPGNHDMDYSAESDELSMESFRQNYGPEYYSFEYGNVHYIILDDIVWRGFIGDKVKKKDYVGGVSKNILEWLKKDLELTDGNKLVVISMHIPINSVGGDYDANKVLNKDDFFEVLKSRQDIVLVAGHTHTQEHDYYNKQDGWNGNKPLHQIICSTVCGSWWSGTKDYRGIPHGTQMDGVPRGFNVFSFSGSNYTQKYYPVSGKPNYQLRISSPNGVIESSALDTSFVTVNVFNGNKNTVVKAIIDDSIELQLKNELTNDPVIAKMIKDNPTLYKNWMRAETTSHIWQLNIPNNLSVGVHKIEASAADENGNVYNDYVIFEIK